LRQQREWSGKRNTQREECDAGIKRNSHSRFGLAG
jgi:hypothetical protein